MRSERGMLGGVGVDIASWIYLSVPVVLFLIGWLRPVFALPLVVLWCFGIYRSLRDIAAERRAERETETVGSTPEELSAQQSNERPLLTVAQWSVVVLLVAATVAASGIGSTAKLQDGDYWKHNGFYLDIMRHDWPVFYSPSLNEPTARPLNAYMGYYLFPSAIGKLFGWRALCVTSFIWGVVGVLLALIWFFRIVGKFSIPLAWLFLLFGGLDLVLWVVAKGAWPKGTPGTYIDYAFVLDGWVLLLASPLTALSNGPHHALVGWLAALMLVHDGLHSRTCARVGMLLAAVPLVSAFCALGLIPYCIVMAIGYRLRGAFSLQNVLVAAPILAVTALYLTSGTAGSYQQGFLWKFVNLEYRWHYLFVFYLMEFGVYLILWPGPILTKTRIDPWLVTALSCFVLFPLYRVGSYWDFPTKALYPSVAVFVAVLGKAIAGHSLRDSTRLRALLALLIIGAMPSAMRLVHVYSHGFKPPPPESAVAALDPLFASGFRSNESVKFLLSDGDTFFWRYLAKPARPDRNSDGLVRLGQRSVAGP